MYNPEHIAIAICLVILGFVSGLVLSVVVVNIIEQNQTYTYDLQELERLVAKLSEENKKLKVAMYNIRMNSHWDALPAPQQEKLLRSNRIDLESLSSDENEWTYDEDDKND